MKTPLLRLKHFFLITIILLYSSFTFGQTNCAIDFVPGSNEISYNEAAVDTTLNLSNYDAFFLGESHTNDFEPEFKYHFIKHLNSKYGVRDVFMEIGHSCAYFFNQYLQTGDTSVFRKNRLLYWGRGYKSFWTKLYAYNQTLPDNLKIVIHGIDFERIEIFGLLEVTRNKDVITPDYLQQAFDAVHKLAYNNKFWDDNQAQDILESVRTAFTQHTSDFKNLYGEHFEVVKSALTNKAPVTTTVNPRNKIWYQNMEEIISRNGIKKFIGFFGGAHIAYSNKSSLTVALTKSGFFQGKILNLATIYTHILKSENPVQIVEYNYKEQEVVDLFYNKQCRATIVKSTILPKIGFKTDSDYVIFAKENNVE